MYAFACSAGVICSLNWGFSHSFMLLPPSIVSLNMWLHILSTCVCVCMCLNFVRQMNISSRIHLVKIWKKGRQDKDWDWIDVLFLFFLQPVYQGSFTSGLVVGGSSRSASSPRCKSATGLIKLSPKQVGSKAKPSFQQEKQLFFF